MSPPSTPSPARRRLTARRMGQGCYIASGAFALLMFDGRDLWAQAGIAMLLGLACLFESLSSEPRAGWIPRRVVVTCGLLLGWILLTLIPWPSAWVKGLCPGQAALLADIEWDGPAWLHGSMAPQGTWHALFALVAGFAAVYLAWLWAADRRFRSHLTLAIMWLAAAAAILALWDRVQGNTAIYGFRLVPTESHWGPFVNRNHFANYTNMGALVAVGIFFRQMFPRKDQRGSRLVGLVALAVAALCASLSVATASKGGLLSLLVGLMLFASMMILRRRSGFRAGLIVAGMLLFGGLLLTYGRGALLRTQAWIAQRHDSEAEGRRGVWKDTWRMAAGMRGRGIGVGAYRTVFPAFQTVEGNKTITHVENEYLQVWAEWGIVGTAGLLALGLMLAQRAWVTLRAHPGEWQIAGWSALATAGAHAFVDFPFHIPANAWVIAALAGILIRGRASRPESAAGETASRLPPFQERRALLALAALLGIGSWLAWSSYRGVIPQLEGELMGRNYEAARQTAARCVVQWPFYWRAHEMAGHAAAGLRSKTREVRRCFHRAQRLARVNPMVSVRAGLLYMNSSPAVAREFFDAALAISPEPSLFFRQLVSGTMEQPGGPTVMKSLARRDPDRWLGVWIKLSAMGETNAIRDWTREGVSSWLGFDTFRGKVAGALVAGGEGERVISAFQQRPPVSDLEFYWLGLAHRRHGSFEHAARAYETVCRRHGAIPAFDTTIELKDADLRLAMMEGGGMELRRKVAATLMHDGRYAEALPIWGIILRSDKDDSQAAIAQAIALSKTGKWEDAAWQWEKLAQKWVTTEF